MKITDQLDSRQEIIQFDSPKQKFPSNIHSSCLALLKHVKWKIKFAKIFVKLVFDGDLCNYPNALCVYVHFETSFMSKNAVITAYFK